MNRFNYPPVDLEVENHLLSLLPSPGRQLDFQWICGVDICAKGASQSPALSETLEKGEMVNRLRRGRTPDLSYFSSAKLLSLGCCSSLPKKCLQP